MDDRELAERLDKLQSFSEHIAKTLNMILEHFEKEMEDKIKNEELDKADSEGLLDEYLAENKNKKIEIKKPENTSQAKETSKFEMRIQKPSTK